MTKSEDYIQTLYTFSEHGLNFQRNQSKTVGGVTYIKYLPFEGGRMTEGWTEGMKD